MNSISPKVPPPSQHPPLISNQNPIPHVIPQDASFMQKYKKILIAGLVVVIIYSIIGAYYFISASKKQQSATVTPPSSANAQPSNVQTASGSTAVIAQTTPRPTDATT